MVFQLFIQCHRRNGKRPARYEARGGLYIVEREPVHAALQPVVVIDERPVDSEAIHFAQQIACGTERRRRWDQRGANHRIAIEKLPGWHAFLTINASPTSSCRPW